MITCPKCSKELSDGAKFCDNCGNQLFETGFCPNCGKQVSAEFTFCQSCGASLTEKNAEEQPATAPKEKKKFPKKAILFGGIGVAVVAVLIAAISLFSDGVKISESSHALYLKDKEIYFTDLKKGSEAWQLTSRLVDDDDIDNKDLAYGIGLFAYMSEDGKYIFFPDKVGDNNYNCSLYYKEAAKPDAEAIKIDSDVTTYIVNTSATLVTYLKGEEGNLYQYKIGEDSKEKIASEVVGFDVSDDGKKIIYYNSENSIYLKSADKEKEKIASDAYEREISDDFTTVYYIKDGSLYKQVEGEDRVKIASDVFDIIKIYDSGEIYYLTSESETVFVKDYVTDDMKEADASLIEPTYPDYPDSPSMPYWWEYDTDAEYDAAYEAYEKAYEAWETERDRMTAEYNAAYEAYFEKRSRDIMRAELEKESFELYNYSLCFYNGTEAAVISDYLVDGDSYNYTYASDAPVILYETYNKSNIKKAKLSEIESVYDISGTVNANLLCSTDRCIAVKDTVTVIEQEKEATGFKINSSGTLVYYIDDIPDEKDYGQLYRLSISDGVVGKAEVYDSDVYVSYLSFVGDTAIKYYKDFKDNKGELYIEKKKIDYDVNYRVIADTDLGKVFYYTDWNDEKQYGTLKAYNGEENAKIADDVHQYTVMPDGRVLYLCDYSLDHSKGELCQWADGETSKIADDVYSFTDMPDGRVLYLCDYSLSYCKGELHEWANGETRKIDDDVVCVLPTSGIKYRHGYGF